MTASKLVDQTYKTIYKTARKLTNTKELITMKYFMSGQG